MAMSLMALPMVPGTPLPPGMALNMAAVATLADLA